MEKWGKHYLLQPATLWVSWDYMHLIYISFIHIINVRKKDVYISMSSGFRSGLKFLVNVDLPGSAEQERRQNRTPKEGRPCGRPAGLPFPQLDPSGSSLT